MIDARDLQKDWPTALVKTPFGLSLCVPAKPMIGPFICRLRDALAVLSGEAMAVKFPYQDHQ